MVCWMGWGSWASFVSTKTYSHNSVSIPKNQVRTWSKGSRHLEGGCQSPTPRKPLQKPLHLGLHSEKERRLKFDLLHSRTIPAKCSEPTSSKPAPLGVTGVSMWPLENTLTLCSRKWHTHSPELRHICFHTCLCQWHLLWSLKYIIQHYLNI